MHFVVVMLLMGGAIKAKRWVEMFGYQNTYKSDKFNTIMSFKDAERPDEAVVCLAEVAHVHADERVGDEAQHEERWAHPAQPGSQPGEHRCSGCRVR